MCVLNIKLPIVFKSYFLSFSPSCMHQQKILSIEDNQEAENLKLGP